MLILAIETSCDDTSAALVRSGTEVLSLVTHHQTEHAATGGVVPEEAARRQTEHLPRVVSEALTAGAHTLHDLDAIAVTYGPGLIGSLLPGVAYASTLALLLDIPLIPTHHIGGHIVSTFLDAPLLPHFPFITLSASGGHTDLFLVTDGWQVTLLGQSTDDAAGEAFDKVARDLGLPYPGGPEVERLARTARGTIPELPRSFLLPKDLSRNLAPREAGKRLRSGRVRLTTYDMSFSGLKSEVKRRSALGEDRALIAAGFQESVCDLLATKLLLAASEHGAQELHLTGGVSANSALRDTITRYAADMGLALPLRTAARMAYCGDNAAMIGCAAYITHQRDPSHYAGIRTTDAYAKLPASKILR